MEKIKKEYTCYEIVYKAVDGTEFSNEEDCKKYEKITECVIGGRFKLIAKQLDGSAYEGIDGILEDWRSESDYYLVDIDDDAKLNTVLMYLNMRGITWGKDDTYHLPMEKLVVGNRYIIDDNYDTAEQCWVYEQSRLTEIITKRIENAFNYEKKEN